MTVSKVLKNLSAEEILSPRPVSFDLHGESFPILPMPEGVLITVLDELGKVASTFGGLAESGSVKVKDIAPLIPEIAKVLLPNSTALIAASLQKDAEWVIKNFYLVDRLRALIAIMKAEGVHLLAGEMNGGLELFKPTIPLAAPASTTS